MKKLVNLTGQKLEVFNQKGSLQSIEPVAWKARVDIKREKIEEIDGFNITRVIKSNPVGVPDAIPNTYYIVSKIVAEVLQKEGRTEDILIPDELVRSGFTILGCKSLAKL